MLLNDMGVPTQEFKKLKLALGIIILNVSLKLVVQVPDVTVCVTIYDPVWVMLSTGLGMVLLLKEAITNGTGVFPGMLPTDQLILLIVPGNATVEALYKLMDLQFTTEEKLAATGTFTVVSLQTLQILKSGKSTSAQILTCLLPMLL